MRKLSAILVMVLVASGMSILFLRSGEKGSMLPIVDQALAAEFSYLSTHGNTSCSQSFYNSIPNMADDQMLQGSCCSRMVEERYIDQVSKLKQYRNILQIPPDPYNISAKLAKELLGYDKNLSLTSSEQQVIQEAAANSKEKGFCCCRCWRWFVHEGMAKYLAHEKHWSSQQITDVLNLEDGCGGAD